MGGEVHLSQEGQGTQVQEESDRSGSSQERTRRGEGQSEKVDRPSPTQRPDSGTQPIGGASPLHSHHVSLNHKEALKVAKNKGKRKPQKQKGYRSKGWHGESARHSLASRGIPTSPEESPGGGINITVVGMDSSTQAPPSRLTGIPGRPGLPTGLPGEPPIVSFAEDQALDQEIKEMEDRAVDFQSQIKITEIEIEGLKDERKSTEKIHRAERDELMSNLLGRKAGWFSSHRDLTPAKLKQYQNLEIKQKKSEGEMEAKIRGKQTALKTLKTRYKTGKRDVARKKDYVEDIKEMREKEQRKRVETLEQTRTLNRVIQEGQR